MKLETKAKPVKIRILSGGEEHSSLDSLKKNFCIKDVKVLMDGRLSRWLKQQNEENLAEEIEKFNSKQLDSEAGCLNLIRIIFREELKEVKPPTLLSLAEHWYTKDNPYKQSGLQVYRHLQSNDVKAAISIYKNEMFPEDNWLEIFQALANNEKSNDEGYYILGKLLLENNNPQGRAYIVKAASLGNEEATHSIIPRFDIIDKTELINRIKKDFPQSRIKKHIKIDGSCSYSYTPSNSSSISSPNKKKDTEIGTLDFSKITSNTENNKGNKIGDIMKFEPFEKWWQSIDDFLKDLKSILENQQQPDILGKYENTIVKYEAIYLSAYLEARNNGCTEWKSAKNKLSLKTVNKLKKLRNNYKYVDHLLEGSSVYLIKEHETIGLSVDFKDEKEVFANCLKEMPNYNLAIFHNEQQSNK